MHQCIFNQFHVIGPKSYRIRRNNAKTTRPLRRQKQKQKQKNTSCNHYFTALLLLYEFQVRNVRTTYCGNGRVFLSGKLAVLGFLDLGWLDAAGRPVTDAVPVSKDDGWLQRLGMTVGCFAGCQWALAVLLMRWRSRWTKRRRRLDQLIIPEGRWRLDRLIIQAWWCWTCWIYIRRRRAVLFHLVIVSK